MLLKKILISFLVVMLLSHVVDVSVCTYANELEDDVFDQNDEYGDVDSMISSTNQSENEAKDIKKADSKNETEDVIFDGDANAESVSSEGNITENGGGLKAEESPDKGQEKSTKIESQGNTNVPPQFTERKDGVDNSDNNSLKSAKENRNKKEKVGNDESDEKRNEKTNVRQEKDGDNSKAVDESIEKAIKKESQKEKSSSNNPFTIFIIIIIMLVVIYGVVAWKTKRFLPFRK